ncbi:putative cation/H+ exchanger, sodium/solute symporter superfamily [Helianthus annuus]|uniref:Cation/H+ exchanger, sodium/solute symporter superfamily n=1 Tax=Helianthus annuus TaxID=4232 RepID=A0A251TM18_HELAN|nr:putative cation/H+ exchanger, sodium/solute symporter superfamily [Helianthus annuus]KAJ0502308.1 putative cation/H+ exchanger, sodium/solute symporter superfamily [Helianthus annuus]KAJ0510345.1 putative cation/H+ exchanger, sodium/solute symporter superfamily [Helianthus annuus]KAJ0518230.1 putative cation/H+ exchanger, sodium/solute symporter superfamily [Helianthus annuus]KAJ0871568.1 putative cation/H+ exchanger, sodium/solute symporter superfamily [Helianthus annuus]
MDANDNENGKDPRCTQVTVMKVANIAVNMLIFIVIIALCNVLHMILRPYSQPRIISEAIVGFFMSNLPFLRNNFSADANMALGYVAEFGMICHMFVTGLQIDPEIFSHLPVRETKVACTGLLLTFLLGVFITPFLHLSYKPSLEFDVFISLVLCGTASPLLTRIINDLKIGKSDIGRFLISTAVISDLISILLFTTGYIIFNPVEGFMVRKVGEILLMLGVLVLQIILSAKFIPLLMRWVDSHNPPGKLMKGSHLIVSLASLVFVGSLSPLIAHFNMMLSGFLAGIVMPRDGRLSKLLAGKVKYFFGLLFFPAFMFWVGFEVDFSGFDGGNILTWASILFLFLTILVGKVVGCLLSGAMLGFHWQDSVASGLLLSIKGHFHIFMAILAKQRNIISPSDSVVMVLVSFLTFIYAPMVVKNIIDRARKRSPTQQMALQWLNPSTELRMILCLHGPENIQSSINLMEISQGPAGPRMMVYVNDMIELTEAIASTLARGEGVDAMAITDEGILEMRETITNKVNSYVEDQCEGIDVKRLLTLCPLATMHHDICAIAEEMLASMIILPFHKNQQANGTFNTNYLEFRSVNRKVLRHAPCSVGVFVDRGLGSIQLSRSTKCMNAAIIFIAGKDDREALSYASRVARHPGVKLTVIRFLLDTNGNNVPSRITRARANTAEYEEELKQDDEFFADFYDKHVASGHVAYMEKYLSNSGETYSTIKSLEGEYNLFIVGRGGRVNSTLTAGMNDWEACPELGPIGDILSATDFSVTASVLIIQQHKLRGKLQGLHEEFSIM